MSKLVYSTYKEYHIKLSCGDAGKYVILPGDPGRCKEIAKYLDNAELVAQNREYTTYTGFLDGQKVSVVSTGIGGPSASIALEELVHIGCDTFIRVGTSGGMNENVVPGEVVIATSAVRQEGTTKEYAPVEFPAVADFEIVDALCKAAKEQQISFHTGVVQSKDSFYGQHNPETMPIKDKLLQDWNAWIECGVLASEMETAALFVVGAIRRVRVGSVLLVMGNHTRQRLGFDEGVCHDTTLAIKTAVAAMRKIIQQDKEKEKIKNKKV